MSDNSTLDLTEITSEPVESNIQAEITDDPETEGTDTAGPEEPVESVEAGEEAAVEEEVSGAPVEEEEEPVEEEAPEETAGPVEEEAPEETAGPVEEEAPEETAGPVEEEAPEETAGPVEEEAPEETAGPVEEEAPEETAGPVEEEAPEETAGPVEQVAADIRNILTEVPTTTPVESSEPVVSDQLCSLKTLVEVLGKWSGNEIRRRHVENLLKEGTEVDENLDDIEKFVEVLKLWIGEGGPTFREHNHFKKLDEYTLSGDSINLSEEKKVEVLKTLTELTINVSHRRKSNEEIQNVMNNLY